MPSRLRYTELAPDAYQALFGLSHYLNTGTTLHPVLKGLIDLRASQINGCEFCTAMHTAELRKHHEPETRIAALASWRAPEHQNAFTPRERAALSWTETLTLLPSGSHASDEDFAAVKEFFDGKDLADLTFAIATINAWNRLAVAFRPTFHPEHAKAQAVASASTT